jgi:hypothetical protein
MATKEPTPQMLAMDTLRAAATKLETRAPGQPALPIPLDKIYTYTNDDGEAKAVIPVREVLFLVDTLLRDAK